MLDPDSTISSAPGPESKNSFAFARLRRAFVTCEFLPGSCASEAEIADRFGLGRAAVRAALARLEVEGFVLVAPRAGWMVAPITGASVGEVVAAWSLFARGLGAAQMPVETARALARVATQADALRGRMEGEVVAAARRLHTEFVTGLAAPQGRLIAGWVAQCDCLTQRLTHWFERSNPLWTVPPLTPVAERLLAGDMNGAGVAMEEVVAARRDWLAACLMRAQDLILAAPATAQDARAAARTPDTIRLPAQLQSRLKPSSQT